MNNVTFGDEDFGYYETIAGGAGAVSHKHSFIHTKKLNPLRV